MRYNASVPVIALSIFTLLVSCFSAIAVPALATDPALIEATELNQNPQAWVVLDGRPKSEWQAGHIPGAHSFSWDDYTRTDEKGTPYRVWPPHDLAEALARMGIDENTPVAAYGDADKSWGGEGWACWVLSRLGHKGPIRLLSGGIQAWRAQGYPTSTEPEEGSSKAARYQFNLRPALDIQSSELEEKGASMVLIDTRSNMEWLMGHLPKAIHIPWTDFYTGTDRRPLDKRALKKLLQDHGVDMARPVVYYCAGGIRSAYAWTVHAVCGLPEARNYEGGMEAWKRRAAYSESFGRNVHKPTGLTPQ